MGNRAKRHTTIFIMIAVAFCMLFSTEPISAATISSNLEKVRVGFFQFDGYHMIDDDGIKSGYGYDFIQMANRYADWKIEYVGYENSWGDMLEMLDDGEIDLLTSAQKTPEREEKFDFSDSPIGTSYAVLSVREDDTRYAVGDKTTYNGMRVGLLRDSSRNTAFADYAGKNGFTYEPVYYDDTVQMEKELQEGGKIDAIVTSSLRKNDNERVLEQFAPSDFYAIVKKGNTALLNEVNYAIEQMDYNSSGWRAELTNLYYSGNAGSSIVYTKEELDFLKKCSDEGKVFKVATNPDLKPYSYVENGEVKGIVPEIFKELANRVGITYEYIPEESYEQYHEAVLNGDMDIDLTCVSNYSLAEEHGVCLTDSYLTTTMAKVTKSNSDGLIKSAALVRESSHITQYTIQLLNGVDTEEYGTVEECKDAVLSGSQDGMYAYAYTAEYLVEEDAQNRLVMQILPQYTVSFAMGINQTADRRLLTIVNKGVNSVKGAYVQQIEQEQTAQIRRNTSLLALIYDKPELALIVMLITFGGILVMILSLIKSREFHNRQAQEEELERFVGYVCESNSMVMEINLNTMSCRRHYMENGKVLSVVEPYGAGEFKGPEETIYEEDLPGVCQKVSKEHLESLINGNGGEMYFECRAKNDAGEYIWYSYTIRAIKKDRRHPNNFILFKKNIDEIRKEEEKRRQALEDALETARAASSAKGQFLSKMSHEIRTPLNAVIGYMSIAKDSKDNPEKVMHCVENSEIASRHLLSIINDVLDISSIESGKMKIANEKFDLKGQIGALTTIFFHQAKEKGVSFDVKIHELTEEWVSGDSLRVNQVLLNLLSNAVKFTPSGGRVGLEVTQLKKDEKEVYLKFTVNDTGIGMSEEYKDRIFTPFEQETASTASKYGGTGLGLSITNNLVTMMGGHIDVESMQGEGTTFTVTLHFGLVEKNEYEMEMQQDYSHLRALVVDDEKNSCDYVKSLLKRCGVKSDVVMNGEDAVKQIRRRRGTDYAYDFCIMDWNMPGMNGIETTKLIRSECNDEIPVIIATAYDITEIEDQAKAAGVKKIIAKPLFQSTMFDLLVSMYGKYKVMESEKKQRYNLKGIKVLLAEDNPMNLEIAQEVLTKAGMLVDPVVNGREALERFSESEAGTYQVILMDVQMPELNGYEATAKIRKSAHPDAESVPIIAMTANAFAEDVTEALACGMNGHISKPVDYDKLFGVLSQFIQKKE